MSLISQFAHRDNASFSSATDASKVPASAAGAPAPAQQPNGLTRSRRSHFSYGETIPDPNKEDETEKRTQYEVKVSYDYERMICFAKSPHSWAVPRDWPRICENFPTIVRNKVCESDNSNNNNKYNAKSFATNHAYRRRGVAMSQ